jgi:large subunit ribosomal protein L24
MHIRRDDKVTVITGKDKGKSGKVLAAFPKTGRVVVENVAMVTKHVKPRQEGVPGGRHQMESSIDASNVMLVCPNCKKGVRVHHKVLDNGSKVRVCAKCGNTLDQ